MPDSVTAAGQRGAVAVVDLDDQRRRDRPRQIDVESSASRSRRRAGPGRSSHDRTRARRRPAVRLEDADVTPEGDVSEAMAIRSTGAPAARRRDTATAGTAASRPHQRRVARPRRPPRCVVRTAVTPRNGDCLGSPVDDREPEVAGGERRRLFEGRVVDPAAAPGPVEDPRLAGTRVHCAPSSDVSISSRLLKAVARCRARDDRTRWRSRSR